MKFIGKTWELISNENFQIIFWTTVILILVVNIFVFSAMMLAVPEELRVQYIPDDAYYYLTLARNFSHQGLWTFDSGISLTSGFHLLFAYLLAGAFSLFQFTNPGFVIFGILLSLIFALGSILAVWFLGFTQKNALILMFFALVVSSQNFVFNVVSVTEWSLTVLVSGLYCIWFFTRIRTSTIARNDYYWLFALGFLGSLARSDFGLLPFGIAAAVLVLFFASMVSKEELRFSWVGLAGAVVGLLLLFFHNYFTTSEILQSSAKIKTYWMRILPESYDVGPFMLKQLLGIGGLLLLVLLFVAAIWPQVKQKKRVRPNTVQMVMFLSSAVCILGYVIFYSRTPGVQPWYSANFIIPVVLLVGGISGFMSDQIRNKIVLALTFPILIVLIVNVSSQYPIDSIHSPWAHQASQFQAGVYLHDYPLPGKVGAWNAGVLGYYEGGHIINLDGLVNNDVYEYIIHNELPEYLSSRDIVFILDFEIMLEDHFPARGGYDDPRFIASLQPEKLFVSSDAEKRLILYSLSENVEDD